MGVALAQPPWLVALAAAGLLTGAWIFLLHQCELRTRAKLHAEQSSLRDSSRTDCAEADQATGECIGEIRAQLEQAREDVARAEAIFAEAIEQLKFSFCTINEQTKAQQDLALTICTGQQGGEGGTGQTGFERFAEETSKALRYFIDYTVLGSKSAMELVEHVNDIVAQVEQVQGVLSEIEGISKQTNMLAVNAAIEAARAGEPGRGFAVVADEVRDLSARTNQFSQQIRVKIAKITDFVREAELAINTAASQDVNFGLQSKQHVDVAMMSARHIHEQTVIAARDLSALTREVEEGVKTAVTTMQIQDRFTQLMAQVQQRLRTGATLSAAMSRLIEVNPQRAGQLTGITCHIRQSVADARAATARYPVSQSSMHSASVALS
jgi:methyl-accepting chemotaxis protein